jgi:hypothetical protein
MNVLQALLLFIAFGGVAWRPQASPSGSMTPGEEAGLLKNYCVGCHSDRRPMGGLSLEYFDLSNADPVVASMMVTEIQNGAMGAAAIVKPDAAKITALTNTLATRAVAAERATGGWTIQSFSDLQPQKLADGSYLPPPKPKITATMQAGQSSSAYTLTITCRKTLDTSSAGITSASHMPEILLQARREVSGSGSTPLTYDVDGTPGRVPVSYVSQPDSAGATFVIPLPSRSLTIRNLFPGETVTFPFDGLSPTVRRILTTCLFPPPL